MKSSENTQNSLSVTYRYLLIGIASLAFSLILFGVILRVTDGGHYCMDWPVCSDGLFTTPNNPAFIPYVHRFLAGLTAAGILLALVIAWRSYHQNKLLRLSLTLAASLTLVQILLGRSIVFVVDSTALTAVHFGLSLLMLAFVLAPAVLTHFSLTPKYPHSLIASTFGKLSVITLLSILALLVSGAWVTATGARVDCQGWPLCGSGIIPNDYYGWLNLSHRVITMVSGVLMAALLVQAWRTQRQRTTILVAATTAAAFYASQALMGIVEANQNYPVYLLGLHAATSIAVWTALVVQVALVGLTPITERNAVVEPSVPPAKAIAQSVAWSSSPGRVLEVGLQPDRPVKVLTPFESFTGIWYKVLTRLGSLLRDYLMLTKPVVVALLLVTTFAGMVVGGRSWPSLNLTIWTLLAGFLAAGGSGAINQYIDRFDDSKMQRTAKRPIPSGRLTPGEGLAFGIAATIIAFYLMVALVNFLAALLTLAGTLYYVILYSLILKKTTVQNIVIGGGAGAIPPLVGWAAATGSLNIPSLFLFAVVFMWTPPHFWALALVRRADYARAGVPMLPVVRGERETRWQIFLYTIELVALSLLLPVFGLGGGIYFVSAALLGGLLLVSAWNVWKGEGNKVAWKMYRHSSMYLAFLFLSLMIDALV